MVWKLVTSVWEHQEEELGSFQTYGVAELCKGSNIKGRVGKEWSASSDSWKVISAAASREDQKNYTLGKWYDRYGSNDSFLPVNGKKQTGITMNFFTILPVYIVLSMKSQGIMIIPLNKWIVFRIITNPTLFKSLIVKASVQSSFQVLERINFPLETRK